MKPSKPDTRAERRDAAVAALLADDFATECASCKAPRPVRSGQPGASSTAAFPVAGAWRAPGTRPFTGYVLCRACAEAQDSDPAVAARVEAWCVDAAKVADLDAARLARLEAE
ncbi:MAG TPA: hypothetical protein VGM56_32715 [Byssovorax sp.]